MTIGNGCFFNNYCSIACKGTIVIGANTIFGESVKLYDHNHCFRNLNLPIKEQGYSVKEIKIGENCWIGSNVIILSGSKIGDNCVIGAGAIVKGNVPSNSVIKPFINYTVEERY